MVSAAERVFGLPEVLELILDHLPMKDLLLAQRVSQDFRNGIKASKRLQQRLFLRPGKLSGEQFPYDSDRDIYDAAYIRNRWIIHQKKLHLRWGHRVPLNTSLWQQKNLRHSTHESISSRPIKSLKFLHPALAELSLQRDRATADQVVLYVELHEHSSPSDVGAVTLFAPEPSWRRMLLEQCPCTEIVLSLAIKRAKTGQRRLKGRRFLADTKLGEIMDFCASQYAIFQAGGFKGDSDSEVSSDEEDENDDEDEDEEEDEHEDEDEDEEEDGESEDDGEAEEEDEEDMEAAELSAEEEAWKDEMDDHRDDGQSSS